MAYLDRGISVIICCYNSATRIENTLKHLAAQEIEGRFNCEIVVVNNASTDNLEEVVNRIWAENGQPYPLRITDEKNPGQSFARRRGIKEAQYAYGVFCDDDNWLVPNYLSRVFETFETKADVGLIGGGGAPALDGIAPPWFYTNSKYYAIGIQAEQTGDITYRGYLWGAGMGFRTWLLKEIFASGIEPLTTGRAKNATSSGDDAEISIWFIFSGYRLWYDKALTFKHYIPEARLTSAYYDKLSEGFTADNVRDAYGYYLTLKYGVFNHPRKKSLLGAFSGLKRGQALIAIAQKKLPISSVRKMEKSIQKLRISQQP